MRLYPFLYRNCLKSDIYGTGSENFITGSENFITGSKEHDPQPNFYVQRNDFFLDQKWLL